MISYETFCQIKDYHQRQGLNIEQIAHSFGLHRVTVAKWLKAPNYARRPPPPRASKLVAHRFVGN